MRKLSRCFWLRKRRASARRYVLAVRWMMIARLPPHRAVPPRSMSAAIMYSRKVWAAESGDNTSASHPFFRPRDGVTVSPLDVLQIDLLLENRVHCLKCNRLECLEIGASAGV